MNTPFEEQIAQALRDAAPAFRKAWLDAARPVMQAVLDEIDRQSIPLPATPPIKPKEPQSYPDGYLPIGGPLI